MEARCLELCQDLGTMVPWQECPTEPDPCPTPSPLGASGAPSTSNPVGTLLLGQGPQTHHSPWQPMPASPWPRVPLSPCHPIPIHPQPMTPVPRDSPVLEGCHGGSDGMAVGGG